MTRSKLELDMTARIPRVTKHQLQKHFYHYVRLASKGLHIHICHSKKRSTPIAVLGPP